MGLDRRITPVSYDKVDYFPPSIPPTWSVDFYTTLEQRKRERKRRQKIEVIIKADKKEVASTDQQIGDYLTGKSS